MAGQDGTVVQRSILQMPRKLPRTDAEVERLASEFAARHSPAQGVTPWLRKHVGRLTRLVRNEAWSWDDIGRAMTRAGIVYQSGRTWNGELLAMKASQARRQVRAREAERAAARAAIPAAPSGPVAAITGTVTRTPDLPLMLPEDDEPEFRPVSFPAHYRPLPTPVRDVPPKPSPTPSPAKVDVDEVLRRFGVGSAPTESSED